jgi:hypothetical protein
VLRVIVLLVSGLLVLSGAWMLAKGVRGPGIEALVAGLVVLLSIAFERWRDRKRASRPGAEWQRTGERFEDPATGRKVEVEYDPKSGERRYVSPEHDRAP